MDSLKVTMPHSPDGSTCQCCHTFQNDSTVVAIYHGMDVWYGVYLFNIMQCPFYIGAIQVLRNADGGGGCPIFREKSVKKV